MDVIVKRKATKSDMANLPQYQHTRRAANIRFSKVVICTDADPDG